MVKNCIHVLRAERDIKKTKKYVVTWTEPLINALNQHFKYLWHFSHSYRFDEPCERVDISIFSAKNTEYKNHGMQMKQIFWLSKCKSLIFITSTSCFGHVRKKKFFVALIYRSMSLYLYMLVLNIWFNVWFRLNVCVCIFCIRGIVQKC